jgi:S1-C subfamily serine protease
MVTRPVLERAGHLGMGGDMIVAVNDLRVRTPEEFRNSIAHLKPHDTMYVTVVRPIISGGHRTLRIAIKLGGVTEAMAAPPAEPAPSLRFFF